LPGQRVGGGGGNGDCDGAADWGGGGKPAGSGAAIEGWPAGIAGAGLAAMCGLRAFGLGFGSGLADWRVT